MPMQRFQAPLTAEDKSFARRVGRIVLLIYSSTALLLTAWVIAHVALKAPIIAKVPIEAGARLEAPANPVSVQ
jgi:hypothetical protein